MNFKPWMVLAGLLASSSPAAGQSAVRWWTLDNGFGQSRAGNSGMLSALGQTFVGVTEAGNSRVMGGFLSDPRLRNVPVSAVEQVAEAPSGYGLGQNYPNPFNPSTTIEFSIPRPGRVNLVLYDMLGRALEKLVEGDCAAGLYRVEWNARAYSSGVYVYRLEAGDFIATRKLIVVR